MARNKYVAGARRSLVLLVALMAVVCGVIGLAVSQFGGSWSPKLALDLSGGTQMILSPKVTDGDGSIDEDQLNQAVEIIRQRVDGAGVSEAEVSTQSGRNVVVSMPGTPSKETRDLIQASAQMSFRSVIAQGQGSPVPAKSRTNYSKLPHKPDHPANGSDSRWITAALQKEYEARDCKADPGENEKQDPHQAVVACSQDGSSKYILGPVEIQGKDIQDASHSQVQSGNGVSTGQWGVNISFDDAAKTKFKEVTQRLNGYYGKNQNDPKASFAIMLDSQVLSAPRSEAVIPDGKSQITGDFTEESAKSLSDQLKYGALPISFSIDSEQQISATLGTDQLRMGIIAGLIGLLLVCVYSLFQYRLLGLVTIASLLVAGVITYESIALLGWAVNYRLSLAGVAGLIVAIGQTADSFIVYFERIRDGLREGRGVPSAVDNGWRRAKRTIWASKGVNLLAAVVLYFAAVGNVKGFAFTLGLTAIADLLVIFLFTHPVLVLLSRTRYFGQGRKYSGLSVESVQAVPLYRGAGRVRTPEQAHPVAQDQPEHAGERTDEAELSEGPVPRTGRRGSSARGSSRGRGRRRREAEEPSRPLTIAERRRAHARAASDEHSDAAEHPVTDQHRDSAGHPADQQSEGAEDE